MGTTGLFGLGTRVPKHHIRIRKFTAHWDELNFVVG